MNGKRDQEGKGNEVRKQKGTKADDVCPDAKQSLVLERGVDGISSDILKTLPWRALQKIKNVFQLRYKGQSKVDMETWLRNIIVLK